MLTSWLLQDGPVWVGNDQGAYNADPDLCMVELPGAVVLLPRAQAFAPAVYRRARAIGTGAFPLSCRLAGRPPLTVRAPGCLGPEPDPAELARIL